MIGAQLAVARADAPGTACLVEEDLLDVGREEEANAVGLGAVLDVRRHVAVERAHDLVALVHDRHRHPAVHQVLGHLEPDVAGADDRRPAAPALEARPEALGGVHRPCRLRRFRAGYGRRAGDGPGGDDQLVEALLRLLPLGAVVDGERARVEVDGPDLRAHAHVDPGRAVLLR